MAEESQRIIANSRLFNTFNTDSSSRLPPPRSQRNLVHEDAEYSSGSDAGTRAVLPYQEPITQNNSWNFADDDDENMRRLRSESAAQAQKQKVEGEREKTKQSPQTRASARSTAAAAAAKSSPVKGKGKGKTWIESEDEEEEAMSQDEDPDADADADEEADVDIEGDGEELSEDETRSIPVADPADFDSDADAEAEDQDENDSETVHHQSPSKPRLKIKLRLPIVPASSTSNTATPAPEEERKVTPGRRNVAKRSAAVRGRRRIQDLESSSSEVESEDSMAVFEQDAVEEEDDDDEDMDGTGTMDSTPAPPVRGASDSKLKGPKPRLTTRQAVLASVVDPSHVALDSDLAAKSIQTNPGKKKKVLNETELALRREENARKRKNLTEKRLEDEKLETINRLLKKQSRPRTKRTGGPSQSARSSVPPPAVPSTSRGGAGKRGGSGRGRGRRGRPRASGNTADAEAEGGGDGDTMDIEGQGPGADEEEGDEEVEGVEEEEGGEESVGGSERSKAMQAPVIPMFRWVSTTITTPAVGSESSDVLPVIRKSEAVEKVASNETNGDVDMADVSIVPASHPQPPAELDDVHAKVEAMQVDPPTASSAEGLASHSTSASEKQMRVYLAIPAAFLPPEETLASVPMPHPPTASAICAVSGCVNPRKYRLVKDWKIGACGMEHLKALEGITA